MNPDMAKSAYKAGNQNFVLGITHWLVITLILSLGFGQLLRFNLYGLPIYLHDILVICLLALQGRTLKVKKFDLQNIILLGVALFLSTIRAFTLYPPSSLLVPSLYMFRLIAYVALYFSLKTQKIKIPKSIFLTSAMVTCAIGLVQYIFLPDMRIFQYLGWDDHLSRLTLPHFDPTFTAVMLGLGLLTTIKFKNWLATSLLSLAILLTYSRSVWLSLILTSIFFIKNKIILLLAVSCMLLAILALPQKFGEGTNLLRTYSISSRVEYDLGYIQKYKWDLLIGRGMNTIILDPSGESTSHATGPNNSYLYLLATTGILGLMGWGLFMQSLYRSSIYKPMLLFFFISSLFNNVMFYPFSLLWILLISATAPTSS